MKETEIGYRGSKSIRNNQIVKEQRVDGSYCIKSKLLQLRCTLKGFERKYPIRILSKPRLLLNISMSTVLPQMTSLQRFFYTAVSNFQPKPNRGLVINPLWLTGFIDGEGSFLISIFQNQNKVGWAVKPEFEISLHARDKVLLENIQNYFQIGNILSQKME